MKQIIRDLKKEDTSLEELLTPEVKPECVFTQTTKTLVSSGNKRMIVDFGKANFIQKRLLQFLKK